MTHAITHPHHADCAVPARPNVTQRILDVLFAPYTVIAAAWKRHKVISRLSDLDDRMLADIGLQRFDVEEASFLPAGEDPTHFLQDRVEERRRWERDKIMRRF